MLLLSSWWWFFLHTFFTHWYDVLLVKLVYCLKVSCCQIPHSFSGGWLEDLFYASFLTYIFLYFKMVKELYFASQTFLICNSSMVFVSFTCKQSCQFFLQHLLVLEVQCVELPFFSSFSSGGEHGIHHQINRKILFNLTELQRWAMLIKSRQAIKEPFKPTSWPETILNESYVKARYIYRCIGNGLLCCTKCLVCI